MTPAEAKQVQAALSRFGAKTKVTKEDSNGDVWKITLPFESHNGELFRVYAFRLPRSKKIYLSDGRALFETIKGCGQPHLNAIQGLLETFSLSLMEDLSVMDSTDRSLSVRVMSFLQAWCAVDGMLRIWKITQENVRDALRAAS
jgi:hypothetical protein